MHTLSVQTQSTAITEPRWVRYTLISITLIFLSFFLLIPLLSVFTEGLRGGINKYFAEIGRAHV